jgi:hypothetical protein
MKTEKCTRSSLMKARKNLLDEEYLSEGQGRSRPRKLFIIPVIQIDLKNLEFDRNVFKVVVEVKQMIVKINDMKLAIGPISPLESS